MLQAQDYLTFQLLVTHISGFQLNFVIDAGHSDLTLTTHGEVVGVGRDERYFYLKKKVKQKLNAQSAFMC